MLHLEMRKTALGRPAMEQGGWGLAVQLDFEEQAEWKLTPTVSRHPPVSVENGGQFGVGALSSRDLVRFANRNYLLFGDVSFI